MITHCPSCNKEVNKLIWDIKSNTFHLNCLQCSSDDSNQFYVKLIRSEETKDYSESFRCYDFRIKISEYEIHHIFHSHTEFLTISYNKKLLFLSDYESDQYPIYLNLDEEDIIELGLEDNLLDYYKNIIKKEITLKEFS